MKETHDFLVPDYYATFHCKMGACRRACCTGWPISISLEDYFRLINADCSPALREKMDRGIRIALEPAPDNYAQITPRYDGNCPMRLEDGRCALHAELGESALADVCRLYPRGIRKEKTYEISCANSCEAVLEHLFRDPSPIRFERQALTMDLPPLPARSVHFETLGHSQELRLWFIAQIQERDFSLPQRIAALGKRMEAAEQILHQKDEPALMRLLNSHESPVLPVLDVAPCHVVEGVATAEKLLELVDDRSSSVRDYGEEALRYFGKEAAFEHYLAARQRFEERYPNWEILFEHMLVNHMFFSCFPFQDRQETLRDEFIAICVVYTLLRFLCIGWMAQREAEADLVDVCAAAFRLIDHTEFDRYASHRLSSFGNLYEWIIL